MQKKIESKNPRVAKANKERQMLLPVLQCVIVKSQDLLKSKKQRVYRVIQELKHL